MDIRQGSAMKIIFLNLIEWNPIQSLDATKLEKNSFNAHSSLRDIVYKEVFITLHSFEPLDL